MTTIQSPQPCCECGVVEEFLIEQCPYASPPFIHPTDKFCDLQCIMSVVPDPRAVRDAEGAKVSAFTFSL